jgi:predicted ATPase
MVNTVDYLLAQGTIIHVDGQWDLQHAATNVRNGAPPNIQQLIERQIERVSLADQQTLEVASVAGAEFSAATVAAGLQIAVEDVEKHCAQLARRTLFLQSIGSTEWPDGTVADRYSFLHALYQHVLYERIPTSQRIGLHQRIGERLEQAYGARTREMAAELAAHFERGRDFTRAIHYLRQAGENATRRSAHSEAVSLFTKGLELLQMLPHTSERIQQEIRLYLALGAPLITLKGYASPEVEYAYSQARKLCLRISETRYLFPAVLGLCGVRHNQAEFRKARILTRQLLHLARKEGDPTRQLWAHVFSGTVLYSTGKVVQAQKDFREGITLYDARRHGPHVSDVIHDPGVHCRCYVAETLWLQGYANQARQLSHQGLSLAQQLTHFHSRAVALSSAVFLHNWLREPQTAHDLVKELITLTHEQSFPQWFAVGTFLQGWTRAKQGWAAEGVQQMRQGLAAFRDTGAKQWLPFFFCELAWAYGKAGQPDEGLTAIAAAQAAIHKTGECSYEAELYRLKGQLTLQKFQVSRS